MASIHRPKKTADVQAQDGENVGPYLELNYELL